MGGPLVFSHGLFIGISCPNSFWESSLWLSLSFANAWNTYVKILNLQFWINNSHTQTKFCSIIITSKKKTLIQYYKKNQLLGISNFPPF